MSKEIKIKYGRNNIIESKWMRLYALCKNTDTVYIKDIENLCLNNLEYSKRLMFKKTGISLKKLDNRSYEVIH